MKYGGFATAEDVVAYALRLLARSDLPIASRCEGEKIAKAMASSAAEFSSGAVLTMAELDARMDAMLRSHRA